MFTMFSDNGLDLLGGVVRTTVCHLDKYVFCDKLAVVGTALNLLELGVHEATAQVRSERSVEVNALEQRAGGHLDAGTFDGRRRGRRRSSGRRDADAGRRSDGRRRRSDGRRRRRHISVEVALHQQRHHVLEVEEDVRAYVALPTYTCIVSAKE